MPHFVKTPAGLQVGSLLSRWRGALNSPVEGSQHCIRILQASVPGTVLWGLKEAFVLSLLEVGQGSPYFVKD